MRTILLALVAGALTGTAALAVGPGWNGPGWYIVMDSPIKNQELYRGAYRTQDACLAAKPDDKGAIQYECVQYFHEPLDN